MNEKILIVDDAKLNIKILSNILSDKYEILIAQDGESTIKIAREYLPDLVLLDIILPDTDGFEIIKIFKNSDELRHIPIICITGLSYVQDEIKGLRLGAIDYIKKPFVPEIVLARVDNQIVQARQRKLVEDVAKYDALTQIPNRGSFDRMIKSELAACIKRDKKLNVGYFDIDFFKQYNDNYGHAKGDEALRLVASCANWAIKESGGFLARIGGEEFGFILPDTDEQSPHSIAENVNTAIESLKIEHLYSKIAQVLTISIGGISAKVSKESNLIALLKKVDDNLYAAKKGGRNCVYWT